MVMGNKPARPITDRRALLDRTLVECSLETGRTRQIRVHLDHPSAPAGWRPGLWSRRQPRAAGPAFDRQFLHARKLGLNASGERSVDAMEVCASGRHG